MLVTFSSPHFNRFGHSKMVENRTFLAHYKLGQMCCTLVTYTMVPRFKSFYAKKNKLNYYAKYPIIQMKTKHNPYVYIFVATSGESRSYPA